MRRVSRSAAGRSRRSSACCRPAVRVRLRSRGTADGSRAWRGAPASRPRRAAPKQAPRASCRAAHSRSARYGSGRVPALALADDAQGAPHAFGGARRLGERARERMLELMDLLGALLRADVAADAAVAFEDARLVEQRLAAHRHPDDAPVFGGVLDLEIAEWLVPGELRPVALPVRVSQVECWLLPVLAADVREGVRGVIACPAARDDREAKLGVLLPIPVGEELYERGLLGGLGIRGTVWCGARNRHASHCAEIYTYWRRFATPVASRY